MVNDIFGTMILGTLAVMAWSIMYRENKIYRFAEDLTVGVMGGYTMAVVTNSTNDNYIQPLLKGELINIIPILLGIMIWMQLSGKYRYIARTPLAFITGIGAAIAMKGGMYGNILTPIKSMSTPPATGAAATINHIIIVIACVTAVMYFFFTVKPVGALKPISRIGRIFMMVGFGCVAGSSVISYSNFFYNRAQWIVTEPYAWVPCAIAVVVIVYDVIRRRSS